jgi:hypothetical protein
VVSALGEEFRSAREARGLSLSDVAERLHIRSVYLAAIEDEDWHVIGAPVYVRGFMRTYARFLGLDAEAAVARFSATVPAGTPAASAPARSTSAAGKRTGGGDQSSPSVAAILAIVVAIAVVLFVGYEFYQYHTGSAAGAPVADAGSAAPAADGDPATPAPDAVDSGLPPPVAAVKPLVKPAVKRGLSIHLTEASWLRVDVDGVTAYEGTLPAGAAKSFLGKSAVVRVGNAGGVQIAVNGKAVGPLGASGDVVERRFVLSGE